MTTHAFQFEYVNRTYDLKGKLINNGGQLIVDTPYTENGWGILGSINSGIAYTHGQLRANCSSYGASANSYINTFQWIKNGVETYRPPNQCLAVHSGVADLQIGILTGPYLYRGKVYACGGSGANIWIRRWPAPDGAVRTAAYDASLSVSEYTRDTGTACDITAGDDGNIYVLISYAGGASPDPSVLGGWGIKMLKLDRDLNLIYAWYGSRWGVAPPFIPGYRSFAIYQNCLVVYTSNGDTVTFIDPSAVMYRIEGDHTLTLLSHVTPIPALINPTTHAPSILTPLIDLGGGFVAFRAGILKLTGGLTTLAKIVGNISKRNGLTDDDYDVSGIQDPVRGFAVTNQSSGRANIESLIPGFIFGAVESDTAVKFSHLSRLSVGTIPNADLGVHTSGSETPKLLTMRRTQEVDLPRRIFAKYLDYDADYQDGVQLFQRTKSISLMEGTLNLPIVFTASEAKRVVDVNGTNAWMEREQYAFSTSRRYAHLEPLDVVTVQGIVMRLVSKDESVDGVIKWAAVGTAKAAFAQGEDGTPGGIESQEIVETQKTDLLPLDIPLPTDESFANGYPVLMAGADRPAWRGAQLFKSADGGTTYTSILSSRDADTFGVTTTRIADFTGGNVFDESGAVTVVLSAGSGTLASATSDAVLNGANEALIGNEIIQFKVATLTGTRTYDLSGLLRGRRGTEWATSAHEVGETFAALPAVNNYDSPIADVGLARKLKAVTVGGKLATATAIDFTNNGRALQPYAPAQLGGGPNGAGDVTLTWVRRTRIGGLWRDLVGVPLSETTESYVVQIWNSSYTLCARIISVSASQTTIYTSAMQVTDFGAQQAHVYFTVGQLGSISLGSQARGVASGLGASDVAPLVPIAPYAFATTIAPPPSATRTPDHIFTNPESVIVNPFLVGQTWCGQFTTPATPQGIVAVSEQSGPRQMHHAWIATDTGGVNKVANSEVWGNTAICFVGTLAGQAVLTGTTTYYFFFDFLLQNGTLAGNAGDAGNSLVSLQL